MFAITPEKMSSKLKILPYSFDIQNSENKKLICIIDMPGLVCPALTWDLNWFSQTTNLLLRGFIGSIVNPPSPPPSLQI